MRNLRLIPFVVLVALVASNCFEAKSETCPSGIVCPPNSHCAANQDVCIPGNCGNGVVDLDEVCDDGNVISGDGCSADCLSEEYCGNGYVDTVKEEVCDDGNRDSGDGCSADCLSKEGCGNGKTDVDEECDDGNLSNDDNCLTTCKVASCGDGFVNDAGLPDGGHKEYCDPDTTTRPCSYGETCLVCDSCQTVRTVLGPFCGDRVIDRGFELCDDGDAGIAIDDAGTDAGVRSCPYGADGGQCTACSADCQSVVNLTGPYCGDGTVDADAGGEKCDDGNAAPCGTCSADCKTAQSGAASGTISAVDSNFIIDGESFTISNGATSQTFEFDKDATTSTGTVAVQLLTHKSGDQVADAIVTAITNANFQISASRSNNVVSLTNNNNVGGRGNVPITYTVSDPSFSATGMSGGGGRDCVIGVRCTRDQDCLTGNTCQGDGGVGTCLP